MKRCLHLSLIILVAVSFTTRAEEVEFPEEELARETVLPRFAKPRDVLNRHINTTRRLEFGAGGGLEIDEPFYNDIVFKLHGGYHFNELHGFNVEGIIWGQGLSSYGEKLKAEAGLINHWDASKAPHPAWAVIGNYEFTAYYGKISVTKQSVMNLNLFGFVGPLYINMKTYNAFGLDFGIGQNFFISKSLAVRFTIAMLLFKAPNAASYDLSNNNTANPNPKPGDFEEKIFFNNQMALQLVFLL